MPLAISGVHAQQHLRPVGGIHSTSFGANSDKCLSGVIFARQQGTDFKFPHGLRDDLQLLLSLGAGVVIAHLVREFEHHAHIFKALTQ